MLGALSTSGGTVLNAAGYVVALVALARGAEPRAGELDDALRPPPPAALGLVALVGVPSVVGLLAPPVLDALERRPDAIRDGHEWWRLLTAALVQDGGVAGTLFNLVVLLIVAGLAARVWGGWPTVAVFVIGALLGNVAATWWFETSGAGNSLATFGLAGAVLGWLAARERARAPAAAAAVMTVVAVGLVLLGDGHGIAFLTGLLGGGLAAAVGAERIVPQAD